MIDNKMITDTLLDDVLSGAENSKSNHIEREQVEELLALYHLSHLSADAKKAGQQKLDRMPDTLLHLAQESGERYIAAQSAENKVVPLLQPQKRAFFSMQNIAAAACLLIALFAWYPRVANYLDEPKTIEQTLTHFAQQNNTVSLAWEATGDKAAENASGQVLWNQDAQQGYMQFSGLQINDSTEYQYQLWIFDKSRDANGHPVDGGVFDIDTNGKTLVAIDAKLLVDKPYLFAVTIEKPGGVVVSKQERIVLLAKVGA